MQGFEEGRQDVVLDATHGYVLPTRSQLLDRVRSDLADADLVAALLADRRREAAADTVERLSEGT